MVWAAVGGTRLGSLALQVPREVEMVEAEEVVLLASVSRVLCRSLYLLMITYEAGLTCRGDLSLL